MFKIFQIPDRRVRIAFLRATNELTADRFVRDDGTHYGKIHLLPDCPRESVEEMEEWADHDGFVAVFFTNILDYPFGHERYETIYEAAELHDLPIMLHGESSMYHGVPTNGMKMDNYVEVHTLVHPFLQTWHATSIIGREVPVRYDVDGCSLEAGPSWVQMLARRMDRST